MKIQINGNKANTKENFIYKGQGMISCNGSSRLLLDYKEKSPRSYKQILEYLYGRNGLKFTHFKVELGSDVNTSSGTEPTTMRFENEKADVTRGAGFMLAADIKKINPDVTLDMLWWSEPRWVTDAEDIYAARYKWYKKTLDAAYETYGLMFDYVSANKNERGVDANWIIYLSHALKNEKDCPYDYSKIKIVAADECGTWNIAGDMINNKELLNAVDVIGSHYTSLADRCAKLLAEKNGKELWFSEGSSPMTYAQSTHGFDEGNSGLTGINGVLDVANRMITMVSGGYMTMYEYQPAVAAYYDGVTYCQKQLINANTPWNGYYLLDSGFFMSLHFSQFMDKGWAYIYDACNADGKPGGDGHCLVDARFSFITACSKEGDYTTIITNTTSAPITYEFEVTNLAKADNKVYIWETKGPECGQNYDANYFKKIASITPDRGKFTVTVKPYSLVTVSTVDVAEMQYTVPKQEENTILSLPYYEDFNYTDEFLYARSGAPLYTTDEGGAFEVIKKNNEKILMQKITRDIKADEWGGTPEPTTNFGDDRWYNYSVSADVLTDGENSYAGVGLRYILADDGMSGYGACLYDDGSWCFFTGKEGVERGQIADFDASKWHNVKISALYNDVTVYIDNQKVLDYRNDNAGYSSGRAALYSSYNNCCYKNVRVEATDNLHPYVQKIDNFDSEFTYSPLGWSHGAMTGFRNYKRTLSKGTEGAYAEVQFKGCGIILAGVQECESIVSIEIDGEVVEKEYTISKMSNRQSFFSIHGLAKTSHTLKLTVVDGECAVDEAQVIY
ncbi:MAG: family 16 glycoside hydrolase [Lachnospiraceae bacterium]